MQQCICLVFTVKTVKGPGFATYHWVTLGRLLNLSEPQLLHVQSTPVDTRCYSLFRVVRKMKIRKTGHARRHFVIQGMCMWFDVPWY